MNSYACLYFPGNLEQEKLGSLGEACMRFSSQVALRPQEAVFLEVGRSRLLYQRHTLTTRLEWLGRRYGAVQLGFGRHAAEALALARRKGKSPDVLPLESLHDYASPFLHDGETEAQVNAMIGALHSLGLKHLRDFLALPAKSIGERFGAGAAILRERVEGDLSMAWPRFEIQAQVEEKEDLRQIETMDSCANLEMLLFSLKGMLERALGRLRGRGQRVMRLRLQLMLDLGRGKSRTRRVDVPMAMPQSSCRELLVILRQCLEVEFQKRPLGMPVASMTLEVLETAPGQGGQVDFFDMRERKVEAWNSLITRLSQKLGPDQVFLAELVQRYLPERAWRRILKEPQAEKPRHDGILTERPTRLLPQAIPLLREGDSLLAPGRRRAWHATAWEGPERLSGEWWDESFDRDYYRVNTEEGRDLWVYAHAGGAKEGVWLQGYFD